MALQQLDYWYDNQQERFLQQMMRAFSGFQYMTGRRVVNGIVIEPQLKVVPCSMAAQDRTVGHILRNNSENTAMSAPRITIAHVGLAGRRGDLQHTGHVDTRQVLERDFDEATGQYTDAAGIRPGRSYTVERMMPRPFEMTVNVDIWTSNQQQKYQLMEQILVVVYPDFQIQNSDNALDWTAMTMMELTDIQWSSRSIPVGVESDIDVATLTFRLPFWLSPPAKVMQQRIIEQIITNVYDGREEDGAITDQTFMFQHITTPGNNLIEVHDGLIRLLGPDGAETDVGGEFFPWKKLIDLYGTLRPGLSKIHLKTSPDQIDDWSHDIIGTLQYDATNPNIIHWQVDPDTLPANSQGMIDGVIDPIRTYPGQGLPGQVNGQRYLILHDLGPSQAWGALTAKHNDIIEYRSGAWTVVFSPTRGSTTADFVLNANSGNQLRWNGMDWVKTIEGIYPPGYWRLTL